MSYKNNYFSVIKHRKFWWYRFLESLLGLTSSSILFLVLLGIIFWPVAVSIFVILYGFLWFLKVSLSLAYTFSTFKLVINLEKINWKKLLLNLSRSTEQVLSQLEKIKNESKNSKLFLDLISNYENQIRQRYTKQPKQSKNSDLKDQNQEKEQIQDQRLLDESNLRMIEKSNLEIYPEDVWNIIVLITYNEDPQILSRSIQKIYQSSFNLQKTVVFVSQEERKGSEWNTFVQQKIAQENSNLICQNFQITDLNLVFGDHKSINKEQIQKVLQTKPENFQFIGQEQTLKFLTKKDKKKLKVFFTQHLDGLVGEIKASGPNANWGARQASLWLILQDIPSECAILSKFDADHQASENYLTILTWQYLLSEERLKIGFEPIPIYINNFTKTDTIPRLIGIQNTFWIMTNFVLGDELHFFSCYALPFSTLREIGFWYSEVISEECFVYYQGLFRFAGEFQTLPLYAPVFLDAVEGDDWLSTFVNQYKQLQRWAWGAVEEFPYIFYKFFLDPEGAKLDARMRLKITYLNFTNSIFWATTPLIFGPFLSLLRILADKSFNSHPVSLSLLQISTTFTILSFSLMFFHVIIIDQFLLPKVQKKTNREQVNKNFWWRIEWLLSPISYLIVLPFPALDAQIRGLLGKYLGYWVTPKK